MANITYLPKFYSKEQKEAKYDEMRKAIDELIGTGKLNEKEVEELKEHRRDLKYLGDTYSRNYVIRRINWFYDALKFRDYIAELKK